MFGVYGFLKPWQSSFQHLYFEQREKYSMSKDLLAIFSSGMPVQWLVHLLGFVAGAMVSFIVCPTELIKIQLQVNTEVAGQQSVGKRGFADCAKYIYQRMKI